MKTKLLKLARALAPTKRPLALIFALTAICATTGAWAAPYVMSNADGSAYHWDGGYNWDSGAASPNEISFTLSNPSGVWANGTFPNSGKVALTCISISGRKDGSNADIHHIVLQETGGNSYTSSSVEVLDGASDTANCFVTTLAGGDSDHTYNTAGTYGQGAGQKTINVYFDNVAVDVTKAITLTTYTAATTKGKLGSSVVTSPKTDTSSWKAAMRIYGTYYYDTDTSVSALNTIIDASSDSEVVFALADGVEIDVDEAFSTASHTVKIVSAGSITLSAASQPATTHFTNVDFSGVKGAVLRSWLTPGVVGYNFRSSSGSDTSVALVSGGTWLPASTANEASGSTTAMFADGLSTFTWSSANTWAYSSGTILNGYLDDPSPQASVSLSNVPYEAYDLIVYLGTDTDNSKFRPVTVNGTSYTWDSSSSQTTTGSGSWGLSQQLVADYGINALRINNLSGPLAIKGGSNSGGRGCIAAIQIMPAGTLDSDYVLTLDGTATSWSTGTWTFNGDTVSAPTVAHSVEIVASASTTLTIDTAASVGHLIINGTGDATVTISKGSAALSTKQVTVKSGILKHGSDNSPLGSPSLIVVEDGGAADVANMRSSGYYTKIAGRGVLKDGKYTGALFSSSNIGGGSAQLCGITLAGNATIRCDYNWGIIRSSWYAGTLSLGGYTLTKAGSENFWICNVADSGSGNIVVNGGKFTPIKYKSTFSNATLTLNSGATLRMDTSDGGGATDLEVKNLICDAGSTVNIAAAKTLTVTTALTANGTMKPLGTVTCNGSITVGGDVVVPSDKTWTVTGTLTVADGGKLEIKNNALVPGTLALSDGGTLKIANVSDAAHKVTAGTVTFPASGLAIIDVSDIPDVEEDGEVEVLAGSTSLPADVSTLRIVGKKYSLESESNTLKVVNDGGLTWNSTDGWTKDVSKYGDATITSPGTVALGGSSLSFENVTLSGSGTVNFSATGSETVTIKNLEIGTGVTLTANSALDLASGCTITGDGTLDIPVGTTYAMDSVICSAKVTVKGTLETSGTTSLSGANTSAAGSLIKVVSGATTLAAKVSGIEGNITIASEAELIAGKCWATDGSDWYLEPIKPSGSTIVDVGEGGRLTLGLYIWYFGANTVLNLRANSEITGNSRSSTFGNLSWIGNGTVNCYGDAQINAAIRTKEGFSPTFNVSNDATLTIASGFVPQTSTSDGFTGSGSLTKAGAGTLDLSAITPTKPLTINAGTVVAVTAPTTAVVNDGAVLNLTNTGSYTDDRTTDMSGITGTGTILYNGKGWHSLPKTSSKFFADTLSVVLEQETGVVCSAQDTVIGSISGTKNLRTDLENYPTSGTTIRTVTVKQAKDGTWDGIFTDDRLATFIVQGGVSNTGTLTLTGTFTETDAMNVAANGSVKLASTCTWKGDVTVNGEFGGTGSITGNLTMSDGSTFKAFATDSDGLSVSGTVSFPTTAGQSVIVDTSGLTLSTDTATTLITSSSLTSSTDISKLVAPNAVLEIDNENHKLLAYKAVASVTFADGSLTFYRTLGEAHSDAGEHATYKYITILTDMSFQPQANYRYKIADGVSVTTLAISDEFAAPTANTPDEETGAFTYNMTIPVATTYTWSGGGTFKLWSLTANWTYNNGASNASRSLSSEDSAIINLDTTTSPIILGNNSTIKDISIGNTVKMSASTAKILTVTDGITLTAASATLAIPSTITIEGVVTTDVEGKGIMWTTEDGTTTYSVGDPVAQIGDIKYGLLANAIEVAENGDTVTLVADCSEAVDLGGKSITFSEGDHTFTGSFTGTGTLTLSAWLKQAATARWANPGWEGTVVIPAFTVDQLIELNKYGISGSTVRVMGGTVGWLSTDVVNPTIELGADWSLPYFSPSFNNTLTKLKGAHKFTLASTSALDLSQSSYSPYFLIKDVSEFTGSLETHTVGMVLGRNDKPSDRSDGGKILVYGTDAKVASGKTWAADSGILVNGTLTVEGTLPGATTVNDGSTLIVDGASATVSGVLTLASGSTLSFADEDSALDATSVVLPESGAVSLDFAEGYEFPEIGDTAITLLTTGTTGLALGKFEFDESIVGSYCLAQDGSGNVTLSHAKARIGTTPYAEVADALDAFSVSIDHNIILQVFDDTYVGQTALVSLYGIVWDESSRSYSYAEAAIDSTKYATISDAIANATAGSVVKLNKNVTANPALPAGVSLNLNGYTLTGTVTAAAGYVPSKRIVDGKTVYTADPDTTGEEWTGAGSNTEWTNPDNWSLGFVPVANTPVTFPTGTHTVGLTANESGNLNKCASLTLNGDVTLQRGINNWVVLYLHGTDGVSGTGMLTLNQACMKNSSGSTLEISCPLTISGSNDSAMLGSAWSISGAVTVNGYFKCQVAVTVTGNASFGNGAKVETQGTMTFSGTTTLNGALNRDTTYGVNNLTFGNVVVAAVSSITGSKPTVFSGTVTLNAGTSLTIPNSGVTVSGATFETPVENSYVKREASGSTYVYSIDTYKAITTSLSHASLTRTDAYGNSVEAGTVITFTVAPATYYTVSSVTATVGGETTTLIPSEGVYSYTVNGDVTITVATSCSGVEVEVDTDVTVAVDPTWIEANSPGATATTLTTTTAANGYKLFECYALGLSTTVATDKPIASVAFVGGNYVITLKHADGSSITAAANVSLTLTVMTGTSPEAMNDTIVATSGEGAGASFTINPASVETVKYYKIKVVIGSAE